MYDDYYKSNSVKDIQEKTGISEEHLKDAIRKYDKHFNKNITIREQLEREWADYVRMAIHGENQSRVIDLANNYVSLSNPDFPAALRQNTAYALSWLDDDFFDLVPDGETNIDSKLSYAVKTYMHKQLRNPRSRFYNTIADADLQARLFNISGIAYTYAIDVSSDKQKQIEFENGKIRVKRCEGEKKIVYQGARAHFVNMFNCYPDLMSEEIELSDVDIYFRTPARLHDLKNNPLYDANSEYAYQDFVIYRDNCCLEKLDKTVYQKPQSVIDVERDLNPRITMPGEVKDSVEVRSAYLKEFCIKSNNEKYIYENVFIVYAKHESEVYPLLVEYNHNPFHQKNILLFQSYQNPWGIYGKSQSGLSYNHACWSNFLRAAQAYRIGKSTFKTRFVPAELYDACMSKGISKQDVDMGLRGAGYDIPFTLQEYSQGNAGIFSPDDIDKQDLPLLQQENQETKAEEVSINLDLQNVNASESTATGVNYVQAKQTALYKRYLQNLSDSLLKPFLQLFLNDLCQTMYDEVVTLDIEEDRLEELNPDIEHLVNIFRQTGQNLLSQKMLANGMPLTSEIDPIAMKEYTKLSSRLLSDFKASIEIKIDGNDVDKQQAKADNLELMNLIQSMPDGGGKDGALALVIEEYLALRGNRNKNKYMQILQQEQQAKQQQAQIQQQQLALEEQKINAENNLKTAQANEEQSRADQQNLQNQMAVEVANSPV